MEYEYIILHTHMEDPIATIAFGTEEFTRPVLLYNHASHMAWLGKSIADLYLDSYPLGGGTAMIDAISSGATVLSLQSVYSQFENIIKYGDLY